MNCLARLVIVYEVWGFKKELEVACRKMSAHKGPHEPTLPAQLTLHGDPGSSWAIKHRF